MDGLQFDLVIGCRELQKVLRQPFEPLRLRLDMRKRRVALVLGKVRSP